MSEIAHHPSTEPRSERRRWLRPKPSRSCVQIWRIELSLSMSSADDATLNAFRFLTMSLPIVFVSSVSPDWLKMNNPPAPGVKGEAEGGVGKEGWK